jgi:hypothetical protein
MKAPFVTLTAAVALAAASIAAPSPAQAGPHWIFPALIIGGVVVAATAAHAHAHGYGPYWGPPVGNVYVQPTRQCYDARERVAGGWRKVRVCS